MNPTPGLLAGAGARVDQRRQQVGELALDRLEVDPAGVHAASSATADSMVSGSAGGGWLR
jgi:hypothetical protein